MVDRQKLLVVVAAVLAIAAAGTFLGFRAARPPRPSLPYPSGQSLEHVRSNCHTGNELFGCDSGRGPRSFLTVRAKGDVRDASDALFAAMRANGWQLDNAGLVATDFSEGAQNEDIQPVLCRSVDGCVGLFRYGVGDYVLAWWQQPARPGA